MSDVIGSCCGRSLTRAGCLIAQEGPHLVARCPACKKWIRALPQAPKQWAFPFGKHKGELAVTVWAEHPDYCEWVLTQDWVKPRLREVLEATRPTNG